MPRGRNFTATQLIRKFREPEIGFAQGKPLFEVVRMRGGAGGSLVAESGSTDR